MAEKFGEMKRGRVDPNEIRRAIEGVNFPADKNQIMQRAKQNNAPNNVVEAIKGLPQDRFQDMNTLTRALTEGSTRGM